MISQFFIHRSKENSEKGHATTYTERAWGVSIRASQNGGGSSGGGKESDDRGHNSLGRELHLDGEAGADVGDG